MTHIIRKSEIISVLAKKHEEEIEVCIRKINTALQTARDFPVNITVDHFGSIPVIRARLLQRMKDEGGWTCKLITDQTDQRDGNYYEVS